jgi:hypothetical protein
LKTTAFPAANAADDIPMGKRNREVERCDARKNAVRPQDVYVRLVRGDAVYHPHDHPSILHLPTVIVQEIGRFFHLTHGLKPAFADRKGDEAASSYLRRRMMRAASLRMCDRSCQPLFSHSLQPALAAATARSTCCAAAD